MLQAVKTKMNKYELGIERQLPEICYEIFNCEQLRRMS